MMMVRNLREMRCSDLAFAVDCARTEGRITATVHELENFLLTDARGCWIAQIGKKLLGFSVARWYGKSGFLGAMVLHGNKRSAQLEGELLGCAVRYLEHCGSEQVCAEATQLSLPIYERAGFVKVCRILRFEGALYGRSHRHVSELRAPEFSAVAGLDRHAFRANRLSLLGQRMALAPKLCKVLQLKESVAGYIMARKVGDDYAVGPWIVSSDVDCPADLLEALAVEAKGGKLILEVLETNTAAVALLRAMGFSESPEPLWRVWRGRQSTVGHANSIYAISSPFMG